MSWIINFIKNIFGVKEEEQTKEHKKREPSKQKPKPIRGLIPKKKKAKGKKQGNMP